MIPMEKWGRDHKTTLLYAETRAVDHHGRLDRNDPHMRQDGETYPTKLADGAIVAGHDDYDCLADAQAAGLLLYGGSLVVFTDAGWAYVHALRRQRAEGAKK